MNVLFMTGKLYFYEMYVKKKIISLFCVFFCIYLFINVCEFYIYLFEIFEYFILVGNGVIMFIFR